LSEFWRLEKQQNQQQVLGKEREREVKSGVLEERELERRR
jgi:hypothetical protein